MYCIHWGHQMIRIKSFDQIYFFRPAIDFRKGINGLCTIVQDEMELDLFKRYLFVFTNSKRNRLKALYWDKTGFALWIKHLIEDKYKWPLKFEDDVIQVNVSKLEQFLIGLDPFQIPFHEKKYTQV